MIKHILIALTLAATGAVLLFGPLKLPDMTNSASKHVDMASDRVVTVYGPIDFATTEVVIKQLRELDAKSNKEIIVRIVSPGGGVYAGLMIVDAMQQLQSPVRTVCEGICASMGAVILAAGDPGLRNSMPNAMILIHSVGGGAEGSLGDVELQIQEMRRLQAILLNILTGGDPTKLETVKEMVKTDHILTPQQALDLGLIDEIL